MRTDGNRVYLVRGGITFGYIIDNEIFDRGDGPYAIVGQEFNGKVRWNIVDGQLVGADGAFFYDLIDAGDQDRLSRIEVGERHRRKLAQ